MKNEQEIKARIAEFQKIKKDNENKIETHAVPKGIDDEVFFSRCKMSIEHCVIAIAELAWTIDIKQIDDLKIKDKISDGAMQA